MESAQQQVWDLLNFPKAAYLHRRIPKKQFLENGSLSSKDKKMFKECVESIHWEYTLKPSTCHVLPFKDHEREYLELAVLHIELHSEKKYNQLSEVIHRVIPYPLLLTLWSGDNFALSIAPKRFSQAEQGAFVVETVSTTNFISLEDSVTYDLDFLNALSWHSLPLTNYSSIYTTWQKCFTAYSCALLSKNFSLKNPERKEQALARCKEIAAQLATLRSEIKKAEFNRKVELNVTIKKLEHELQLATASLT